jgi:hypothetical protein
MHADDINVSSILNGVQLLCVSAELTGKNLIVRVLCNGSHKPEALMIRSIIFRRSPLADSRRLGFARIIPVIVRRWSEEAGVGREGFTIA